MSSVPGLTAQTADDWRELDQPSPASVFEPALLEGLPEPARRWLSHAIRPGTSLHTSAEVSMHGQIRLGAWRPFTAVQRLTPQDGFVWAATARLFGLPVTGFDRYTRQTGQMRWRLLKLIPLMQAQGPDITRSAAGRHAGELLLYCPAAALSNLVSWVAGSDHQATAQIQVGPTTVRVTLTIDAAGALSSIRMTRWGNPDGTEFAHHVFGATMDGEFTAGGITLPREVIAGWHYQTSRWAEGQFIRYILDHARYR